MKPTAETDREHIAHMLARIARIRIYTQGKRPVFDRSSLVQDGVLRNLHNLTDSSRRLREGAKASEPGIDWRRMAGMGHILVHADLGGIDAETVSASAASPSPTPRSATAMTGPGQPGTPTGSSPPANRSSWRGIAYDR